MALPQRERMDYLRRALKALNDERPRAHTPPKQPH